MRHHTKFARVAAIACVGTALILSGCSLEVTAPEADDVCVEGTGPGCGGRGGNQPDNPRKDPSVRTGPAKDGDDPGGNAPSDPTSPDVTETPEPKHGIYEVTVNGFSVITETWDHALEVDGKGDEVYFAVGSKVVDSSGNAHVSTAGGEFTTRSAVMGDVNGWSGRVRAGSRSDLGGIRTGDSVPIGQPWSQSGDPQPDRAPFLVSRVNVADGETLVISPTIWEWDGGSDLFADWTSWFKSTVDKLPAVPAGTPVGTAVEATKLGLGLAMSLSDSGIIGQASDRPVGITSQSGSSFAFNPKVVTLSYDNLEWLTKNDPDGKGEGVISVPYTDASKYHGDYTLYLQVKKVG